MDAFKQRLRELGYVEGSNLVLELRFADGKAERLPALVAELMKLNADVIVASDSASTRAAQKATTVIPIVMASVIDPVGSGFVTNLARPGGNTTGFSNMQSEISSKHVELLLAMVPKLSRLAVLLNPANFGHREILISIRAAAGKAGIQVLPVAADTEQKIDSAFSEMARNRVGAVSIANDPFFAQQGRQIADLTVRGRIPAITGNIRNADTGILMSYGQNSAENYRSAATYVDKILKGAKPGDLPVQQPTTFKLIINRKTAKALGLAIPPELLLRADEVIE